MRITSHALAVINSRAGAQSVVAQRGTSSSSSSASIATKTTSLTNTTSPFVSVLQSMGSGAATAMRQSTGAAPRATPAISTESANASAAALATAAAASDKATATKTAVTTSTTATTGTTAATPADTAPAQTGISALITAIQNGTLTDTNVTDPTKLTESTSWGNYTVSNFYYASDDTANQLAQLLGGTVVQLPPFGLSNGCTEPLANFIQLPNGQTVNAASLAYYARGAGCGTGQLAADLTQTINEGAALTNYYQFGGPMPMFQIGYTGPAITGMTYPAGTVAANGTVINPAMGYTST